MVEIIGLTGLRPTKESITAVTVPPYDVIKPESKLEKLLSDNEDSLFHVKLGSKPVESLAKLVEKKILVEDTEPCFYVYEQIYGDKSRTGFFAAAEVSDYSKRNIIRHEKTFDEKVQGRLELTRKTGYSFGPVFLLTKSKIADTLEKVKKNYKPEYEFSSDFQGENDLDGIKNRIFRINENSPEGLELKKLIAENALYIADGHHRYHTALKGNQTHFLTYICEGAKIEAYNRVINGMKKFEEVIEKLNLEKTDTFRTPGKHEFCIYTKKGTYIMKAKNIPSDVIGKLDCSILEKELYPALGLSHDMIMDSKYFDYYPESQLDKMMECVDKGKYDIAVALHPVSIDELMSVADAGLEDSNIVMPEKSTFFAPKILSGIFVYKPVIKK